MARRKKAPELSEDIEVIGPGQLLSEAREKAGYSQQYVADKLNFRRALVEDIENDIFDKSLPSTYNRGYLRNYAKLVEISVDEVLSSYEMLGHAQVQGAEMQSFSKITKKQAENNLLMWISYLILALLIGSTAMWWLQGEKSSLDATNSKTTTPTESLESQSSEMASENSEQVGLVEQNTEAGEEQLEALKIENEQPVIEVPVTENELGAEVALDSNLTESVEQVGDAQTQLVEEEPVTLSQVTFLFSGDCWVNIYDATGERVAWGVKKTGYEMKIEGIAPFQVTLGKPELVTINFRGTPVDLSAFNKENIAKFTLPLSEC